MSIDEMNGPHEGADDDRVNRLLARLQRKYSTRITGELRMPATAARQAPIPESMHPALREALAARGQRFGRASRRNRPCLGVLVATSDPLDQYMVQHPEFFLGASPEHARIHPNQLLILMDHVRCAAFELPFQDGDQFDGPGCNAAIMKATQGLGGLA